MSSARIAVDAGRSSSVLLIALGWDGLSPARGLTQRWRVHPVTSLASTVDLADAIRRAAVAHGEHEKRSGGADADWPDWYALHMACERAGEGLPT